jgi:acyl carrier protein
MADARERLIRCFSAVFPDLDESEIPRATKASVGAWDSLANFSLLTVIEEEFGIRVDPDDVDRFIAFETILDYLEEKQNVP